MTTTLDVLNHMLGVNGESPVSTAESDHPSVLSAQVQLQRVRKEVQERGWWFNTEYSLTLSPNGIGQVLVPTDTLYIDSVDPASRLVRRGNKLYDPVNHTYILNKVVIVNAVIKLSIEELPEVAATYIQHLAAYDFYANDDGDEGKSNRLERRVSKAWAELQQAELKVTNLNSKDRPAVRNLTNRMRQQSTSYNPNWPGGRA